MIQKISSQFFQGFFDADGSIQILLRSSKQNNFLKCYIIFSITQSKINKDILFCLKKQYGGNITSKKIKTGTEEYVYRSYITSVSGQIIKKVLLTYLPLNPKKRQDFLIACKIQELLKDKIHYTKKGQIYIINLIYKMSNQLNKESTIIKRKPIEHWIKNVVNPTNEEKEQGEKLANLYFNNLMNFNIKNLLKDLPTTKFSKDYMVGVHCGDGSLMITFN